MYTSFGFVTFSPPECDAETDVMPSIPALWRQRIRWPRGAFTDLGKYGLTRITAWYYAAQALWCFGMLTVLLIAAQITLVIMVTGTFHPAAVWMRTLPLFIAYRVLTVRRTGWKGMLAWRGPCSARSHSSRSGSGPGPSCSEPLR